MSRKNKKIILIILTIGLIFTPGGFLSAQSLPAGQASLPAEEAGNYPKLANYYLKYFNENEYETLAKWNLLIMPPEMTFYNKNFFTRFRQKNKEGVLLSYVYPAMINEKGLNESSGLHNYLYEAVEDNNWWLRDGSGQKVEVWPDIYAVNLDKKEWRDFNADYVSGKINTGEWDGIMYDTVNSGVDSGNGKGVDINCDGIKDDKNYANQKWQEGMTDLFKKTREKLGDKKIILINGDSLDVYQPNVNGRMFETFPTPWEGNGSWQASMSQYLEKLPAKNFKPQVYVLNANTNNTGVMDNYRKVRFGLASALLGDGYFSFDHGDQSHAQTWWYDEYDVNLGKAETAAYNLLDKNGSSVKPGLWRRDFDFGATIVNSTDKEQKYVFSKEEFERINGSQDRRTNDGAKTNWVKLAPNDGVVLLKINKEILNNTFNNGSFVRVFNAKGEQARNGFFAYKDSYAGEAQILVSDIDNDGEEETLVNGKGIISIYKNGKKTSVFAPYEGRFKGEVSMAVGDLNNDGAKEIITGAGAGGGPQVRIFDAAGKVRGQFFAYDKNFRGGVNVAVGDTNGDGAKEIIAGAGAGGGPQVRMFNKEGKALGQFFAYEQNVRSGIKVMADDLDNNNIDEVLASTLNF